MEIPTAEKFLKEYNNHDHSKSEGCSCRYRDIVALREFAKLHVEAALKAAVDNYELNDFDASGEYAPDIDEESILNSYPLENII
jgi:hypothetical protein